MIAAEWVVIATDVTADNITGVLTIFKAIPGIQADSFPLIVQQCSIAALLSRLESDENSVALEVRVTQEKKKLFGGEIVVSFHDTLRNQLQIGLRGLVIPTVGIVKFELYDKRRLVGGCTVDITGDAPAIEPTTKKASASGSAKNVEVRREMPKGKTKGRGKAGLSPSTRRSG